MNIILVKLAFVLLVTSPLQEKQAGILIQSIRDFGGIYADSPEYSFPEKAFACVKAEDLLKGETEILVEYEADTTGNYAEVKHTIEQSIGWAIEKDFEAMYKLWADDMFHFWLTSDSRVIGLDNFKKYSEVWKDPGFRGTRFEFRDLRITFSQSGDVAWYSCFLDDCGSFNGEESCLKDVFQTGVLEKRNGRWVHTLMHGSYPIDKIPENYIRQFYSPLFVKNNGD